MTLQANVSERRQKSQKIGNAPSKGKKIQHTQYQREFFNTTKGRWLMKFNTFESLKGENMSI